MRTMLIGLIAVLAASPAAAEPFVMGEGKLAAVSAGLEPSSDVFARITSTTVTSVDGVVTRKSQTATLTGPGTVVLRDGTRFTVDDVGDVLNLDLLAPGVADAIREGGAAARLSQGAIILGDGTELRFDDLREVMDVHLPTPGLIDLGALTATFLPLFDMVTALPVE
ncbi:hypothetical protein [Arenibaculum sp.]|uniref:hypothetical protein n=1 Tax=Arenibaculum sp. TaxID=2865862 RepID=UPI002E143BC6|nr:hypothetical protein [Arenibaculum sp.]